MLSTAVTYLFFLPAVTKLPNSQTYHYKGRLQLLHNYSWKVSQKSRIRETKHLSTDADSSTDTTLGWTKNTQKPDFFEKRKNHPNSKKLKNVWKYAKISNTPFDQRSLIHWEAWFPGGTRIPQKLNGLKTRKKIIQNPKTQKHLEICQN